MLALGALVATFVGGASAAPGPGPDGLTALALDGRVELAWQPVGGASAYSVYRGTSPAAITTQVTPGGGVAGTSFADPSASNGTTYYYVVRSISGGTESADSVTAQVTPKARSCTTGNVVMLENCFPGDTTWKLGSAPAVSAGGIEGFATATSVDHGQSLQLKINTAANAPYNIEIFRSGYYGGSGARLISTIRGLRGTAQPACTSAATTTGLLDCSNWSVSATVTTSAAWPSGVYLAHLERTDNGAENHILFVVRDDGRSSELLYGVPFTTYQAYNNYGGKSLYDYNSTGATTVAGGPRAVKVSFDRPFEQARVPANYNDWYTRTDYEAVYWLERSGYDVAYQSVTDMELNGARVKNHKAYMLGAHDEYYSAAMRSALEQARDANVGLFNLGANASYWKIRFENGPTGGQNRVEVCYKTIQGGATDPVTPTTTWRDPAGPNNPENALLGVMYIGDNSGTFYPLRVSTAEGADRSFRFTGLDAAAGGSTSIGTSIVGWEWDARAANGFEPSNVKTLASSAVSGNLIQNNGQTYSTGPATANAAKYRAASGALVFSTGTNQWSRGFAVNAEGVGEPDVRIQQTTTNVLEDMGVAPRTPAANIRVDDPADPDVVSTVPGDGQATVALTTQVKATFTTTMDAATITTASFTLRRPDGTSVPANVAYDGATKTATLTPSAALANAVTYTARLETSVKSSGGRALAFRNTWAFTTIAPPTTARINSGGPALTTSDGRAFTADGSVTGGSTNSTTRAIGGTADPALYQNERWGQFRYTIPVTNGTYDVKLHFAELYFGTVVAGNCVGKRIFGVDIADTPTSPDLANLDICASVGANAALVRTISGVTVSDGFLNINAVYGAADDPEITALEVIPAGGGGGPPAAPTVTSTVPANAATNVSSSAPVTATFSRAMDGTTLTSTSFTLKKTDGTTVPASISYDASTSTATLTPTSALADSTSYNATVTTAAKASDGTPLAAPYTWSFTTSAPGTPSAVRINVGGAAYTSATGLSFLADRNFSGGSTNSTAAAIAGTSDQPLYRDERWGNFTYAIPVVNGTYDVKLHFAEIFYVSGSCIGKRVFSIDVTDTPASPDLSNLDVCAAAGGANTALVRTIGNVSVADGFLNLTSIYGGADDPELTAIELIPSTPPPPGTPPTVTAKSPDEGNTGVSTATAVTATFSRPMDASTITTSSFTLKRPDGTSVPASVSYDSSTLKATLAPSSALATSTTYTATLASTIKASDGVALASSLSWTFTTGSSGATLSTVRINSGGSAYTTSTGVAFSADANFTGGSTFSGTGTISGTNDQALYQNERWGLFSYAIPVTNGSYDVKLHFVELYYGTVVTGSCSGKRIFGIDVADTAASPDIANLDICGQVGPRAALVKTISGVQVTDGTLNIQSVYGSADDPELAAIEVVPSTGPPAPPPDPAQVGQWSAPASWPLVAVHMSMLPTGNVLVWDGFAAAPNSQRIWNPSSGNFTPVAYGVNIFCAGHVTLADGRTFIAGGHQAADVGIPDTTIFNAGNNSWTAAANMSVSRWYPTATELGDGRVFVFSGDNIVQNRPGQLPPFEDGAVNSLPEIYNPATNTWTDFPGAALTSPLYPFMFLLADGRVLNAGPDRTTRTFNPASGTWSTVTTSSFDGMSAVMYRPGKIMKAGSWADPDFNGSKTYNALNSTGVLDMNQPSPAWRNTAGMAFPRAYQNLTMLPDGTVLTTGGMTTSDGIDLSKAVLPAEIWDPATETWRTVASEQIGREYHSTALLLPDGRVLMAGGGQLPGTAAVNQTNAEIYSPPYLFKGSRPAITSAPSTIQYGSSFSVQTPAAANIASVSLIKLPSVTHAFDQDQRFQFLNFTKGSGTLNVTAPASSNLAPPGYYMLFILDANGVPSVASIVRFPAPSEDSQPPTAPTNLTATAAGTSGANLSWTASTDNVGVTRYSVYRSTTSGFTPSLANRIAQVTGTTYADSGLAAGTYYYVVKAEDAVGNLSGASNQASVVIAADTTAPTVSVTSPADGATVSGTISVTASASDNVGVVGVQFKLDGANLGAEDTSAPYSVSWNTATASTGGHALSAVSRDAAGNSTTSGIVNVTVTAPPADTTPPTVSVTAPAAGATVSATINVTASASDNVGVAGVQFKLDGANLGAEDTSSPYSVSWNTTTASNGAHTLTAVARDTAGNSTSSAGVGVTVDNSAPPPPVGLVAAYSFDQGSGTTAPDASGNNNTGTLTSTTWSLSGKYGGALSFNGTSSFVRVADSASLHLSTGMTLEAWVNPNALGSIWRTVILKENGANMQYGLYAHTDTSRPSGHVFTTAEFDTRGTAAVAQSTWTHLAVTYDGSNLRLYVNGTQVSVKAVIGAMGASTGPLKIGGNAIWGEWFSGLIDEVRIYNRALAATEIQTDMNTRVGP